MEPEDLPFKLMPYRPPGRGRPKRHPVDVLRTRLWFHAVKLQSGLPSPYAIELAVNAKAGIATSGDGIKRPRKWDSYAAGKKTPRSLRGKLDAVEMAEAAFPGTARWYRSPIWPVLKNEHLDRVELESAMGSLEPALVDVLFRQDASDGRPRIVARQLHREHLGAIIAHASFDSLVAVVLLVTQSELVGSAELREWALEAYTALQPEIANLPQVEPFHAELFTRIDRACPHWVFPSPNQRLLMTVHWHEAPWAREARSVGSPAASAGPNGAGHASHVARVQT